MSEAAATISVIVPVHNVSGHVSACIESLRAQSFLQFEVIIVDDGSTDDSLALARDAAQGDTRFRFVERPNGGLSAARNTGLGLARGAFIAFVDSDDRVAPDYLAHLHAVLEGSDADWVACAIRFDNADGRQVLHSAIHGAPDLPLAEDAPQPVRFALQDWTDVIPHFPSAWNKLYRRRLIEGLRFDEGTFYEDHAFFWRAAARTDHLMWLPEPLYWQTQGREGQITRQATDKVFDQFMVLDHLRDIVAGSDRPGGRSALARMATRLVHERSMVLTDPERRARFIATARGWFAREGLSYSPDWDEGISRTWGLVMDGHLPLSVIVPSDGAPDLLISTLDSLAAQTLRDFEVIVVPDTEDRATLAALRAAVGQSLPTALILDGAAEGVATARNRGLAAAQGRYVVFLDSGDRMRLGTLAGWVEGMIRHDATFGASRFQMAGANRVHNGFHDIAGLQDRLAYGRFRFDSVASLALHAHPSAKIFERDLLVRNAIRFPPEPLSAWMVTLQAALAAGEDGLFLEGAGVEIATTAAARRLWRDPVTPDRLMDAIESLAASLPLATREAMPEGWLRRLFARAIWEKLNFSDLAPEARSAYAAAAATTAARFAGETGALDPYISPEVVAFFGPSITAEAIGAEPPLPGPRVNDLDCTPPTKTVITHRARALPPTENYMQTFRTPGGASLAYDVDFSEFDFANVSFFDRSRSSILFHLSLRFVTSLAVSNRRIEDIWEYERPHQITLAQTGDHVEILFGEIGGIVVLLNDVPILAFETEYTDLDRIACFNYQGGLVADSVTASGASIPTHIGLGDVRLILPMTVEGWAYDPESTRQVADIEVEGLDAPLPALSIKRPDLASKMEIATDALGLSVSLPGRVWLVAGVPDQAAPVRPGSNGTIRAAEGSAGAAPVPIDPVLTIQPRSNGIPCGGAIEVRRSDIIAQIERIAVAPEGEHVPATLLLAIEHARFGQMMPLLSSTAQDVLIAAATRFNVLDFLLPPDLQDATTAAEAADGPAAGPDSAARKPAAKVRSDTLRRIDPVKLQLGQLHDTFVETMRREPETDPGVLLADLLRGPFRVPPEVRRGLYLTLVDFFCTRNEFDKLHARAAVERLAVFQPNNESWHDSAILPFLLMENRVEEIRQILWRLGGDEKGWLVTSAISFVVRSLIVESSEPVSGKMREDVLYAFMALIDQCSPNYWGRSHCLQLIAAAVELLVHTDVFADYLQRDILSFVLRTYGLSRAFWEQTETRIADDLIPTPRLAAALRAFRQIETRVETGKGPVEPALQFFEALKCPDADRLRIELLGPAGVDQVAGRSLVDAICVQGRDLGEAALRSLSCPSFPVPASIAAELAREARLAMADRYDSIAKAPFYSLQIATSRQLQKIRDDVTAGRIAGDGTFRALAGVRPQVGNLARTRSRFIGMRMEIGMINALLRNGDHAEADILVRHLLGICGGLNREELVQMSGSPALQAALYGMRRLETESGEYLASAVLSLFPDTIATLPEDTGFSERADPSWAKASPLFDTIVTVFSCKPNLPTRVAAMREGWLRHLADIGVPFIVVVGDGDGRRAGDVVHLDAPDDYEGLPQKTLATIRWVHDNTPFANMVKIDDDCFLNVAEYFHSLSYGKFDYYGRSLTRNTGQTDRAWHITKSTSPRGRMELDKSPEPSTYADGGSGYALSRLAMTRVLAQAESVDGQRLIRNSFMEDKMVGDLLSPSGTHVNDEDYYVTVQRRTHSGAIPVSLWANGFHASRAAGVKLVHFDSEKPQVAAMTTLDSNVLVPKKLWSTHSRTRLVFESNALELVSTEERLKTLNKAPLAVVACMRNEIFMLPHFLDHYRKMGVGAFLIADNLSDDGTLEYLAAQPDVALFSVDTSYSNSYYGVAWQQAILANLRLGRWSLVADADELLICDMDRKTTLPDLLSMPEFAGADAARIFMLDMYPEGPLSGATFTTADPFTDAGFVDRAPFRTNWPGEGTYCNNPTWTSALRHRLIPGSRPELFVAQKIALLKYKPWMRLSAGLHYVADVNLAPRDLVFAHFKYNSEFRAKALAEVARRQHFNDAEEYRKYLALLSEGRDRIYDPALSVRWQDCDVLRDLLAGKAPVSGG